MCRKSYQVYNINYKFFRSSYNNNIIINNNDYSRKILFGKFIERVSNIQLGDM